MTFIEFAVLSLLCLQGKKGRPGSSELSCALALPLQHKYTVFGAAKADATA